MLDAQSMNSGQKPIYLDYHSTTPVDPRVLEAMLPYFDHRFGNAASRSHSYGWQASEAVELARRQVASLLRVNPEELFFTSGATEGLNTLVKGEQLQDFYWDVVDGLYWLMKQIWNIILRDEVGNQSLAVRPALGPGVR